MTQGDAERELGIPFSPLCDRETTMVSQSQIGFIDFIITPTFNLLCQLFLSINVMLESKAEEILRQHTDSDQQDSEEMLHKVNSGITLVMPLEISVKSTCYTVLGPNNGMVSFSGFGAK